MERWICRQWTYTEAQGWTSDFDTFATREEAEAHGEIFVKYAGEDEKREYEVYKNEQ